MECTANLDCDLVDCYINENALGIKLNISLELDEIYISTPSNDKHGKYYFIDAIGYPPLGFYCQ